MIPVLRAPDEAPTLLHADGPGTVSSMGWTGTAVDQGVDPERQGTDQNDPAARPQGGRTAVAADGAPSSPVLTAPQVGRVLAALMQDEIRRATGQTVPRAQIGGSDRIDEDGLGLDSLARLQAIAAVTAFFGLASTGLEDYLVIDPRLPAWTEIVLHHLFLRGPETEITFTSSGSSGLSPKRARHRLGDLIAEVEAVTTVLGGPARFPARILSTVPPQHIYGFLFSVLLPDRLGRPVQDVSEAPPTSALRVADRDDLVVGTPFTWQLACDGGARTRGPCTGLVSTAPAPDRLWSDTRAAGVARMVELYGSSETSGVGWRDAPGAAFSLLPHLLRQNDAPARATATLALPDRLTWIGTREFRLGGRLDDSVKIAGTNVAPAAIVRVLTQVRGVAEMAVRLDGDRLKAFVVPDASSPPDDLATLEHRLRRVAARNLAAPARPARYTFGPALPRTATGKLADWIDGPSHGP